MTDYTSYFNPEIEAILQDIARDPKAKLLKVPSSGELVYAMREVRVGIAAPSLTHAEQKLLEVYRDEVGELLKQRCLIDFFKQPDAEMKGHRSVRASEALETRDEGEWMAAAESALNSGLETPPIKHAVELLERCVTGDTKRPIAMSQFGKVLQRLGTHEQADLYIALDLLGSDRLEEARAVYEAFLRSKPSPFHEALALESLGVVLYGRGEYPVAMRTFDASFAAAPDRIGALLNATCCAIESAERAEALQLAARLNQSASPDDPGLSSFVRGAQQRGRSGGLVLSPSTLALIEELRSTQEGAASRVCDSFRF